MGGKKDYPKEGFELHDSSIRFGLIGGMSRKAWGEWRLDLGAHGDYVRSSRSLKGTILNWTGSYEVVALAFGLSGRIRHRIGELSGFWLGIDPGYFVVLHQNTIAQPLIKRSIGNDLYLGFAVGLVFRLKA